MMALTQENVRYTLNSGPGVMNKSNRVHARIQEFLSGGGWGGGDGVEARRPENSLDNVFFSHQLILQFTECIQYTLTKNPGSAHGKQGVHGIAWRSNSSAKTSMCIQPCFWLSRKTDFPM